MKQIVITFLTTLNVFFALASGDSTRVSFCTTTGDNCYGKPSYSESIEVLDSVGRVVRDDDYSMAGCWEGVIDSIFRKNATNIYQYDTNGNLINHLNSVYFLNDSIQNVFLYPSIKSLMQHFANLNNYSVNHCNFILLSEAELSNAGEQLN